MIPLPPGAPADRCRRPATIRLAVVALYAAAVSLLATLPYYLVRLVHLDDQLRRATVIGEGSPADAVEARNQQVTGSIMYTMVVICLVALLVAAAVWAGRVTRAGQVAGIVAAGVPLLCCLGIAGLAASSDVDADLTGVQQSLNDIHAAETPTWVDLSSVFGILGLPLFTAVAVLLLVLPATNRHIRSRRPLPAAPAWISDPVYGGWLPAPPPAPVSSRDRPVDRLP